MLRKNAEKTAISLIRIPSQRWLSHFVPLGRYRLSVSVCRVTLSTAALENASGKYFSSAQSLTRLL